MQLFDLDGAIKKCVADAMGVLSFDDETADMPFDFHSYHQEDFKNEGPLQ